VIGTDPATDLAVIKIDGSGLPIAILGDSDAVEQGDWVVALGSPFGLQQTLTVGVVSATKRELQQSQFSNYIQTDASINPGNSGGPLVNMEGEVIGINTMIIRGPFSQGNVGIGFAIASNNARTVFDQLVKAGRVSRGYLGVTIVDLDEARARSLGVERDSGVLVQDVPDTETPAGKAGIMSGDVITAFDGNRVRSQRELTNLVAAQPVGKSVRIDFLREGQQKSVTVELAERPETLTARQVEPVPQQEESGSTLKVLGIVARSVTQEIAERMKLRGSTGALVISVTPGSPAAEAQIGHGDIIHRIDRTEVKSVEDLMEASKSLKADDEVAVQIEKGGRLFWVTLRIE
jgi:serine protease Do